MIYRFSDFEQNNESLSLKFGGSYKLHEASDIFKEAYSTITADTIYSSLSEKLKNVINDDAVVNMIVRNSKDIGLLESSVEIIRGEYINIGSYALNISLALGSIWAIMKGYKAYRNSNKITKAINSKFDLEGKNIDDVIDLKGTVKLKGAQVIDGVTLPKDGIGTIVKKEKWNLITKTKEADLYKFIPSGYTMGGKTQSELTFLTIPTKVKPDDATFWKSLGVDITGALKTGTEKTIKFLINNKLATGAISAFSIYAISYIFSNFSKVLDNLIAIGRSLPSGDTGINEKELLELKGLLGDKDKFIEMFKKEIESSSEFQGDLNLTAVELSLINSNIFIGKSKDVFEKNLEGRADRIGYLVSWQISSIIFDALKANVSTAVQNAATSEGRGVE